MTLKKIIRGWIRGVMNARTHETINDALIRHKFTFLKKFYRRTHSIVELRERLILLGVEKGDHIIVHASWRAFIGFSTNPREVNSMLLELVGEQGTILMPAYGYDIEYFDVNNTPSHAGALSEDFRKMQGVIRSCNSYFSVCAKGKYALELTQEHQDSEYGFDDKSPYFKLTKCGGKVLLLGMGKIPYKISAFHCATYQLRDILPYYNLVLSNIRTAIMIDKDGKRIERQILTNIPNCRNSKHRMKHVFRAIPSARKKVSRVGLLDVAIFDAQAAILAAYTMGKKRYPVYNLKAKKELFILQKND